ncbi:hypothetical protein [uncultured Oxalicibacterium sp.]|uniref:hypothetical protein n=1 Tax=uncultured Oxalicibacterium sp. TaxID=1168540 RepID=UPI0025FF5487|nr:hypothetical protein [uncultured Oxalicibacterium sp.]
MSEFLLNYRFPLVISILLIIAVIWLWQAIQFSAQQKRARDDANCNHQLGYDYLIWKLDGDVALADELIRLERERHGGTLAQAIERVNNAVAKDELNS